MKNTNSFSYRFHHVIEKLERNADVSMDSSIRECLESLRDLAEETEKNQENYQRLQKILNGLNYPFYLIDPRRTDPRVSGTYQSKPGRV